MRQSNIITTRQIHKMLSKMLSIFSLTDGEEKWVGSFLNRHKYSDVVPGNIMHSIVNLTAK
jgi:hypothetical protein